MLFFLDKIKLPTLFTNFTPFVFKHKNSNSNVSYAKFNSRFKELEKKNYIGDVRYQRQQSDLNKKDNLMYKKKSLRRNEFDLFVKKNLFSTSRETVTNLEIKKNSLN